MLFRGQPFIQQPASSYDLNAQEKKWVENALQSENQPSSSTEPKVIVVKQESKSSDESVNQNKASNANPESDQYNNPYVYAYPPEYYYDEDDDYEDDYEDRDEDDYEE